MFCRKKKDNLLRLYLTVIRLGKSTQHFSPNWPLGRFGLPVCLSVFPHFHVFFLRGLGRSVSRPWTGAEDPSPSPGALKTPILMPVETKILVLLSASVKRFCVCRMWDFSCNYLIWFFSTMRLITD